jgi:hypothetical protein
MALHAHGFLCNFEQLPFGHFIIESHTHNLKYMHSSKRGLNDEAIPHNLKDDWIWFFLPWGHAPS